MTLVSFFRYVFIGKPLESLEIDNRSILNLSGIIWTYSFIVSTGYGIVLFLYDERTIIGWTEFLFGFYVISGSLCSSYLFSHQENVLFAKSTFTRYWKQSDS